MNYEALVDTSSCIKLKQSLDVSHRRSGAVRGVNDILKPQREDGSSSRKQLARRVAVRIKD